MIFLKDAFYLEADLLVSLYSSIELAGYHRNLGSITLAHKLLIGLDGAKNRIRVRILRVLDCQPCTGIDARVTSDNWRLDATLCANVVIPVNAEDEDLAVRSLLQLASLFGVDALLEIGMRGHLRCQ